MANLLIGRPIHWTAGQFTNWPANPYFLDATILAGKSMDWPWKLWIGWPIGGLAWNSVDWLANQQIGHPLYYGSEVGSKNKANPLIGWPIIDCPANPTFGPIHNFWMQEYWLANPLIGLENYGLAGQLVDWPVDQRIGQTINRLAIHYTMVQK